MILNMSDRGGDSRRYGQRKYLSSLIALALLLIVTAIAVTWVNHFAVAAPSGPSTTGGPSKPSVPDCGPWRVVVSPNYGSSNNYLNQATAISPNDIWAVGSYLNGSAQTLVEHWNGTSWSVVTSPNYILYNNVLGAVSGTASNDVWAVGGFSPGGIGQTLIEHWNGLVWNIINSPNVTPGSNWLGGVKAISSSNVWAVGNVRNAAGISRTLIEHWNGSTWSISADAGLLGESDYLTAIAVVSPNDIWAVGSFSIGTVVYSLVEHWNGTNWTHSPSPNVATPGHNVFTGVVAVSANNVWAVGYYTDANNFTFTLTEHWNNFLWTVVPSPNVGSSDNYLQGVAASPNDVWAVGRYYDDSSQSKPLTEHWNGLTWGIIGAYMPLGGESAFSGVVVVAPTDIWAVGNYLYMGTSQTLVESISPCTVAPTYTPVLVPTQTPGGPTATRVPTRTPLTPSPTPTACNLTFSDVLVGSTFYTYIRCLACRNIINGYPDGTFHPSNYVTRGQLSKIVSNAAGLAGPQTTQLFEDVPLDSTYQVFIGRLSTTDGIVGYVCGGPGEPCIAPRNLPYFRPESHATRGQVTKIVANAAGFSDPMTPVLFQDVPRDGAFAYWIGELASREFANGYSCGGAGEPCVAPDNLPYFRPNANTTRGQTSKMVANVFFPDCQTRARN